MVERDTGTPWLTLPICVNGRTGGKRRVEGEPPAWRGTSDNLTEGSKIKHRKSCGVDFSTPGAGATTITPNLHPSASHLKVSSGYRQVSTNWLRVGLGTQAFQGTNPCPWLDTLEMGKGPEGVDNWVSQGKFSNLRPTTGRPKRHGVHTAGGGSYLARILQACRKRSYARRACQPALNG